MPDMVDVDIDVVNVTANNAADDAVGTDQQDDMNDMNDSVDAPKNLTHSVLVVRGGQPVNLAC